MTSFPLRATLTLAVAGLTMFWAHGLSGANAANSYILNSVTGDAPAKYAPTDQENKQIATHCIDGGGDKIACLCVVKVLKHDLNMRDYRIIAARVSPDEREPRLIATEQYDDTVATTTLDPILRTLLEAPDLTRRCEIADQFYSEQNQD